MKLETAVHLERLSVVMDSIQAGGPGSGRHPDDEYTPKVVDWHNEALRRAREKLGTGASLSEVLQEAARIQKNGPNVKAGGPGSGRHKGDYSIEKVDSPTQRAQVAYKGTHIGHVQQVTVRTGQTRWESRHNNGTGFREKTRQDAVESMIDHHLSSMHAGGEGSGCRGDNCGRPSLHVGLEEGDHVLTNVPVKGWSERTFNRKTWPIGTKGIVQAVIPKTGNNPEKVTLRLGPKGVGGQEHINSTDVTLIKKGDKTEIVPKPVPKSQVVRQYTLPDGGKYTIIKPDEGVQRTGPHDITQKASALKGQLAREDVVKGVSDKPNMSMKTFIYEGHKVTPEGLRGQTVWIHKYTDVAGKVKGVTLQEHNWVGNHHRYGTPLQFEYKNAGKAMGLMSRRYGISIKSREWR